MLEISLFQGFIKYLQRPRNIDVRTVNASISNFNCSIARVSSFTAALPGSINHFNELINYRHIMGISPYNLSNVSFNIDIMVIKVRKDKKPNYKPEGKRDET